MSKSNKPYLSSSVYKSNISNGNKGVALLIVDPQNDFHPGGSLQISAANDDAKRISALIKGNLDRIEHIYVTLDSHQRYHIAHPLFWINARNEQPEVFTTITKKMVEDGTWKARRKEHQKWALSYVTKLAELGNFDLTIWPPHCLVGTSGHNVSPIIEAALSEWELEHAKSVSYTMKGRNSLTEHYSAIKAEVIVPGDEKHTGVNTALLEELKMHKSLLICGQASSHCVNFTVRDIAAHWDKAQYEKLTLLKDAMSPVAGFESASKKFLEDMEKLGLKIEQTASVKF